MSRLFRDFPPFRKPRFPKIDLTGRILLGLGGAALCAGFLSYAARIRRNGISGPAPRRLPEEPASRDRGTGPEITIPDWAVPDTPGGTLDQPPGSVPGEDLGSPDNPAPGIETQDEPWIDTLRVAMDSAPTRFGFDKEAWTSPMLAEYLARENEATVPVPRIRKALKKLGYHWTGIRYVPVQGRPHPGPTPSLAIQP